MVSNTILYLFNFFRKKQNNNLSTNDACVIDTILFTSHMLTYICSYNITNKLKYNKFINDFKNNIAILISKDFSYDYFIINKIIENRFHLYDRLTLDEYETNVDNMISEFEYIISNDIISDKIDILSDDFPIVILGISEKMSIRSDIVAYYSSFSDLFSKVIKDVVKFYS